MNDPRTLTDVLSVTKESVSVASPSLKRRHFEAALLPFAHQTVSNPWEHNFLQTSCDMLAMITFVNI